MNVASRLTTSRIIPQKRTTSQKVVHWEGTRVRLLVDGPIPDIEYTNAGKPRKHQPAQLKVGDTVYAKLRPDGNINLYPFDMAGSGYELVTDAEEGVHYEFI